MNRPSAHIAACLVVLASGCATAHSKRADALRQSLDELTYDKPLDEVWQEARFLLAELSYPMTGDDAKAVGQKTSFMEGLMSPARETNSEPYEQGLLQRLSGGKSKASNDWQWLDTGWNIYRERYHVEGRRLTDGCKVNFFKIKADVASASFAVTTRDLEMELDLARRVAPEKAEQIEASAESATK